METYWTHKVKGEFDRSYQFEDPFFRKKTNLVKYIGKLGSGAVKWLSAAIEDIQMTNDTATVKMNLRVRVTLPMMKTSEDSSSVTDKWVKIEGTWYHVPEGFKAERSRV